MWIFAIVKVAREINHKPWLKDITLNSSISPYSSIYRLSIFKKKKKKKKKKMTSILLA